MSERTHFVMLETSRYEPNGSTQLPSQQEWKLIRDALAKQPNHPESGF
jgi:hypothetical protein